MNRTQAWWSSARNAIVGLVSLIACSAVASLALPNYALIDHWTDGVAQREIAAGGWGWVVLQQGWTPAGIYRDTLGLATRNFAAEIAKLSAKAAVLRRAARVGGRFVSRRDRDVRADPGSHPRWPARGGSHPVRGHHASRPGGCSNPARRGSFGDTRSKRAVVTVQRARSGTDD